MPLAHTERAQAAINLIAFDDPGSNADLNPRTDSRKPEILPGPFQGLKRFLGFTCYAGLLQPRLWRAGSKRPEPVFLATVRSEDFAPALVVGLLQVF